MPRRSEPRFFLETAPDDGPPRLVPGEAQHALRVLRMRPGDACTGLDGRGAAWPLRVLAAGKRELGLEVTGDPVREPAPGTPGAPLPWVEVAVSWPRRTRAEEMVSRLVPLGAAALTPLVTRHAGPQEAPDLDGVGSAGSGAGERWRKRVREACKQSGRLWLPELHAPTTPLQLLLARPGAAVALLDPDRGMSLDTWTRSLGPHQEGLGTRTHPILLAIGPEGGFHAEELDAFHTRGATSVRLAPHVLRIEVAAEAAMAVVAAALMR